MSALIYTFREESTATTGPEQRYGPEALKEVPFSASTKAEIEEENAPLRQNSLTRDLAAVYLAFTSHLGHSSTQPGQLPPPNAAFDLLGVSMSDAPILLPEVWVRGTMFTAPSAEDPETRKQREENQRAISLLESWLREPTPSGDLEEASLRQLIEDLEEDRLSARKRFADAGGAP
ncbi:hypothetical protein [Verrucomicrobium sp. 3C]|uniref:hypothetical protein n=1 Tax=Verrucomicrobium sp. 3C TaxID=1134055 RepID=UPI0003675111|nr:hypothetical protein [Verrucomicrobium sp. 3C]